MTLSHQWGEGRVFQLRQDNHDALMENIPFNELSKTFQDAITFTWAMQIPYLWIDSLCIIQSSSANWDREASETHPLGIPLDRWGQLNFKEQTPFGVANAALNEGAESDANDWKTENKLSQKLCDAPAFAWCHMVTRYSMCNLTFGKDRLVAIAGLASQTQSIINSDYLAGLWRRDMVM
jgi:hypothetical protein